MHRTFPPSSAPLGHLAAELREAIERLDALGPDPLAAVEISHARITLNPVPIVLGASPVQAKPKAGPCVSCGQRVDP